MSVVKAIKSQNPPGRFLELEPHLGSWVEVDDNRAIEKTCQTFRKKNKYPSSSSASISRNLYQYTLPNRMCNYHVMDRSALSSIGLTNGFVGHQTRHHLKECSLLTENNNAYDLSVHNDFIFSQLRRYFYDYLEDDNDFDEGFL